MGNENCCSSRLEGDQPNLEQYGVTPMKPKKDNLVIENPDRLKFVQNSALFAPAP